MKMKTKIKTIGKTKRITAAIVTAAIVTAAIVTRVNRIRLPILGGLGIILLFGLSACGKQPKEEVKKPFYITIENVNNFADTVTISKPGKVNGEQSIIVSSQVSARVKQIKKNVGKEIEEDQVVIQLSDDIANYGSQVERAKTTLNNAVLNYNQNKININASLAGAENQLHQATQSLQTSKHSAETQISQATQALENAGLDSGSPTALNIEKIVTDIENQIENLKSQYLLQKGQLTNLLADVLHQGDSLLGISNKYQTISSSFKLNLGGTDTFQKQHTEGLLLELYKIHKDIEGLVSNDISNKDMVDSLVLFNDAYNKIDNFLVEVQKTLNNSVVGVNFPQTQIDAYTNIFNGLQTSSHNNKAGFVNYKNMVNATLGDIKISSNLSEQDIVNSLAKQQIQIAMTNAKETQKAAQTALNGTQIATENSISNAKTALKSAQINYTTSTKNQNNKIGLLANSITQAKINYQDALTVYDKLSVKSPINGTIGDIFVDKGQEISPGTPLFSVVSKDELMVEISVTTEEHELIQLGQVVDIAYDNELLTGVIANISYVAGPTTLYKVQIKLSNTVELLGDIATVQIPINLGKIALPINSVTALQNNKGFIYILNDQNQAERIYVDLGETRNDRIEITSELPSNSKVITSDISNYNPEKFEFKLKD